MTHKQSDRGFWFLMHPDRLPSHKEERLASESSAVGGYPDSWDRPGSSFLWVGEHHHLNREEVAEFVGHLQRWLDTGSLEPVLAAVPPGSAERGREMPKFRKKAIAVDAEQWFPGNGCRGVRDDYPNDGSPYAMCGCRLIGGRNCGLPHVHPTRADHGVTIDPGDWIIAEQDGSGYYPCKSDVFAATYDTVE